MYRGVDALVINKTDLLPFVEFDMTYFQQGVQVLSPELVAFPLSCKTGEGMDLWINWVEDELSGHRGE
jgi:hydrogenase nickel incorporation protein HypB